MEETTGTIEVKRGRGRPKGYKKCPLCKAWIREGEEHKCVTLTPEPTPEPTIAE